MSKWRDIDAEKEIEDVLAGSKPADAVTHAAILREIHLLRKDLEPVMDNMSSLTDMILAWKTTSMFGRAVKWFGGIIGAIAGAWALYKGT